MTISPGQPGYGVMAPNGGMTATGDPQLEAELQAQGVPAGGGSLDVLNPIASLWKDFWKRQRDQSIRPPWLRQPTPRPTGPGSPGFGVLDETKAPKGGLFLDKQADRAAGVDAQYDQERGRLQALVDAILGRQASPSEVGEAWAWAVDQIDSAEELGADPMDPWHWLEQRKTQAEADRVDEGPRTITQTQRSINLTDPVTAGAVVDQTLRNLLGRRATDDEREQFMSTLRSQEQANPTVTTSTTTYGAEGETVDTSSTTTGGAPDAGTAAQAFADDELLGEQKIMLAASYLDAPEDPLMANIEIDLSDPAAAQALVMAALRHHFDLDRWPTDEEVSQAIKAYTRYM